MTNQPEQFRDLLTAVERIAREAGEEILRVYNQAGDVAVETKEDESPLTAADLAAHHVIQAGLSALPGDWPILSEESGLPAWEQRRAWSRYWLVDPLDGTKEFIGRNGEFTVNIALIDNHEAVLGVVHVPVTGVTYSGTVGIGATITDRHGARDITTRRMEVVSAADGPVTIVASRRRRGAGLDAWLARIEECFQSVATASMGSSLKICLIAEGKADLYPRLAPTSEWDTAAAHAVLNAAGGILQTADFRPLQYNTKDDILNPYFVAIGDPKFDWQSVVSG